MQQIYSKSDSLLGTSVDSSSSPGNKWGVNFGGHYTLKVTKTGSRNGTITSNPDGINCGNTCFASFTHGTTVTLTAIPDPDSSVVWTDCDIASGNRCIVLLTLAKNVIASIKTSQTIGPITFNPTTLKLGGTTTASATVSSGLPVTFSSKTRDVCTVYDTTIYSLAAGTCIVAADQEGDKIYNAAPQVTQSINVDKGDQTIGPITFSPTTLKVGDTTTASATVSSGLPVTFSSKTPDVCSVNNNTVTGVTAGICVIAADQEGNKDYNAAPQVIQSINVDKGDQSSACFIATAAYGSPWENQVVTLRNFRDRFLLTNSAGRWFVAHYYRVSPPLAGFIETHPWARSACRWLLTPAVLIAGASQGSWTDIVSILAFLLVILTLYVLRCRKHHNATFLVNKNL